MARRRPTKNIKEVRPTIIGAGITEQWYFIHLQSLFGLKIKIRPRYFGHETMNLLAKRIEQVLSDEGKAVVVFDTDVTTWDDMEKKRFEQLKKKYAKNSNVVICDSMPSIEFWFLLHYVDTSRSFPTSKSVITQMVKYIPNFDKTDSFLRNNLQAPSDDASKAGPQQLLHGNVCCNIFWPLSVLLPVRPDTRLPTRKRSA